MKTILKQFRANHMGLPTCGPLFWSLLLWTDVKFTSTGNVGMVKGPSFSEDSRRPRFWHPCLKTATEERKDKDHPFPGCKVTLAMHGLWVWPSEGFDPWWVWPTRAFGSLLGDIGHLLWRWRPSGRVAPGQHLSRSEGRGPRFLAGPVPWLTLPPNVSKHP